MSREEWVALWSAIKAIENNTKAKEKKFQYLVDRNIFYIKAQIQAEIGQME